MKKRLLGGIAVMALIVLILANCVGCGGKPVIYLYPEETTEVTVQVELNGVFTATYPEYDDGWTMTAEPDGTLTDAAGRQYYCLFWEGLMPSAEMGFEQGFCVAGEDTSVFLEQTLKEIGLTDKEANEFIIYWLPQMENNAYNLISFQTDAYEEAAKLNVTPEPDSVLRVFMTWKPVLTKVEIAPQTFEPFEREGFTVVEWGAMKK